MASKPIGAAPFPVAAIRSGCQVNAPSKARAKKVKTPDCVVAVDLPERLPVVVEEVAILRAFLAQEIERYFGPPRRLFQCRPRTLSLQATIKQQIIFLPPPPKDGSAPTGAQPCR